MSGDASPSWWSRFGARVYDPFLALGERRGMRDRRRALVRGARGRVLELGAGTGLNLAHYPDDLDELVLTEPDGPMRAALERRVARSGSRARVVAAPAETLPFANGAFDTVVCTLVLCTVADAPAAVAEVRRVLAPGGRLLFAEHVRADGRLGRWQDRLAGPWAAFGQGCRCNRATDALLERAFRLEQVQRGRWRGMPVVVQPLVTGAARPVR